MKTVKDILDHVSACDESREWVSEWLEKANINEDWLFPEPLYEIARQLWYACPDAEFLRYIILASKSAPFRSRTAHCKFLRENDFEYDYHYRGSNKTANEIRARFSFEPVAQRLGIHPSGNLPLPGLEGFK